MRTVDYRHVDERLQKYNPPGFPVSRSFDEKIYAQLTPMRPGLRTKKKCSTGLPGGLEAPRLQQRRIQTLQHAPGFNLKPTASGLRLKYKVAD
jgi:hypothetical protein